jgi:hypothetical protein
VQQWHFGSLATDPGPPSVTGNRTGRVDGIRCADIGDGRLLDAGENVTHSHFNPRAELGWEQVKVLSNDSAATIDKARAVSFRKQRKLKSRHITLLVVLFDAVEGFSKVRRLRRLVSAF